MREISLQRLRGYVYELAGNIGAHYDSVLGSPGANDNASGVAALLELSRLFKEVRPESICVLLHL